MMDNITANSFAKAMTLSQAGMSMLQGLHVVGEVKSYESSNDIHSELLTRFSLLEVLGTNVAMLTPRILDTAVVFIATLLSPDYDRYLERCLAGVAATVAVIAFSIVGVFSPEAAADLYFSSLGELVPTTGMSARLAGSTLVSAAVAKELVPNVTRVAVEVVTRGS